MAWVIVAASIIGVFIISFVIGLFLSCYVWRKIFAKRYNGNPNVKYFTAEDFSGLNAEPISFSSGKNTLHGFIYSYGKGENGSGRGTIIFSHGFGAGHHSYTTEIDYFARMGYKVLAFDNTACVSSEGEMLGGFDVGVQDLVSAVGFSRTHPLLKDDPKIFVGHSWGAFSVMNAFPLCEDVSCAVAMCGFKSGSDVIAENAFGKFFPWRWATDIMLRHKAHLLFGKCSRYDSVRSLKNIDRPIYLLYGKEDKVVRFGSNGKKIMRRLKKQPFVKTEAFDYKGHNVYLTRDAEKLMNTTFGHISKVARKDKEAASVLYKQIDYRAVTREDGKVMEKILTFMRENAK